MNDVEVLVEDIINPFHFANNIASILMDQNLVKVACSVTREIRLGMDSLHQNFCVYPEEMVDVFGTSWGYITGPC